MTKNLRQLGRFFTLPEAKEPVALLLAEMAETLVDDVHPHQFIPGTDQAERNWPRRSFADFDPVDHLHRDESWAGAGKKRLFRVVEVVGRVVPFDDLYTQLIRKLEDHRLGNTAEDVSVRGRAELTVYDQENIMGARLADVAVDIQHQWDRPGIHLLCLECRDVVIHFVGDLGLRFQTLRRYPARRRDDQGRALDIEARELREIDGHAVDRHSRPTAHSIAGGGAHPAAHYLPEGAVVVLT